MATLVSPGVSVTVTDESFFIPAAASTVPLFFIATADEKTQADGESAAAGTYEHDVVRTVTSLQQSTELYGVPRFLEDSSGNAYHGDARNEYGVFGLNNFLNVGNLAYAVRANINLNDNESDVRALWDRKVEESAIVLENLVNNYINDYNTANTLVPADAGYKQTVTDAELLSLATEAMEDLFASSSFVSLETDFFDDAGSPLSPTAGYQIVSYSGLLQGADATSFVDDAVAAYQRIASDAQVVDASTILTNIGFSDSITYELKVNVNGAGDVVVSVPVTTGVTTVQEILDAIDTATSTTTSTVDPDGKIKVTGTKGSASTVAITAGDANDLLAPNTWGVDTAVAGTNGQSYEASIAVDGVNNAITVYGYEAPTVTDLIGVLNTDLTGQATVTLDNGNLKVTSDATGATSTVAITDSVSANPLFASVTNFNAILAATAGQDIDSALDVFANGYALPATDSYIGFEGVLSEWIVNSLGTVVSSEWTSQEASDTLVSAADDFKFTLPYKNGTSLGANDAARRVAIVTALQATINSNTELRSENFEYNLILCPGFPEVADEMLSLSQSIKEEAFVIGDTPMNMDPTEVVAWGGTTGRQSSTNIAYYYPHGIASNLDGKNVFVPASVTAIRTITQSDLVSNVWFAPAGLRRGNVIGTSQLGHVKGDLGTPTTFVETNLNQGQRDDLYKYFTNINPVAFFPGRGIVVWGQKTSSGSASALDRINVVRMIMYIRRQLRKNTLPFVFEPNDQLTRNNLKAAVDGFLGNLVVQRGLFDFATVCDQSNNTPDRIDRNEMYIDVAIKPTKAAEFLFIPIRVLSTGAEL